VGIDKGWKKATATPAGLSGMSEEKGAILSGDLDMLTPGIDSMFWGTADM
jgi:hypothetical protein